MEETVLRSKDQGESMLSITGMSIDELYIKCLRAILSTGEMTHPRGFDCKEISPCTTILLNPQVNILGNPVRNAKKAFMAAELLWILMGRNDVDMISFYNSKISEFSENGKDFFGAYGPKFISQLPYIVDVLQKDPWTRQAILNIWRESPPKTKDVPCTVNFQFLRRSIDTLNLIVYMRSQDIWLGFPYDVHNFTCIQTILASILGCNVGTFTLIQGSLHMYSQDFEKAEKAARCFDSNSETTPPCKIKTLQDFNLHMEVLENAERKLRLSLLNGFVSDDILLDQKLQWLQEFARRKHETRNH